MVGHRVGRVFLAFFQLRAHTYAHLLPKESFEQCLSSECLGFAHLQLRYLQGKSEQYFSSVCLRFAHS